MLQHIYEERIVRSHTRIVVNYLVRLREEILFLNYLSKAKHQFGRYFEGHLWLTRQETITYDQSTLPDDIFQIHRHVAASETDEGKRWDWWDSFAKQAVEHFNTEERDKSL